MSNPKNSLQQDLVNNITLICCVFFIAGSSLIVHFFHEKQLFWQDFSLIFAAFFSSLLLVFLNRHSLFIYASKAITFFIVGNLFAAIYLVSHNDYQKIHGKLFANVNGIVVESNLTKSGQSIILENLEISKRPYVKNKNKKKKRHQKVTQKYIAKNYQNLNGYLDIDEEFLEDKKGYANPVWIEKDGKMIFDKPPRLIKIFSRKTHNLKIGDKIQIQAMLENHKKKTYSKGFDYAFYLSGKSIAYSGYALSEVAILTHNKSDNIKSFFGNLRKVIAAKIYQSNISQENKAAINALLTGDKRGIDEEYYSVIKNSGLAHLFSISGLHLSLAAGIFFVVFRFLLTRFEFLILNYDIKKISAILSILSAFIYLNIANMPISAIRAFIGISFFMLSILLDRKISPLRIVFFAAAIVAFINPFYPFFISYQLSFSAILGIIYARSIFNKFIEEKYSDFAIYKIKKLKFLKYISELFMMSLAAQIATTPFLIYHFGNFPIYGILANLIAVPIVTLITMPLGFLSFFLMIANLQDFAFWPMSLSIDAVFKAAKAISDLNFSIINIEPISKISLLLVIFIFLSFIVISSKNLKWLSLLFLLIIPVIEKQSSKPNILIGSSGSYFAFYSDSKGLVFSKKPRKSRQATNWLENFKQDEVKILQNPNCNKLSCTVDLGEYFDKPQLRGKKLLAIYKRVKASKICSENYYIVVNLTKKYELPNCAFENSSTVVDSKDLLKGNKFIFLE